MKADTTNARSYLRPGAGERVFGRILVFLVWIGLVRGHFYVLEVRGRKSGRTVSFRDIAPRCPVFELRLLDETADRLGATSQ